MKAIKYAWIRNQAPQGQPAKGRINCPCKGAPESNYSQAQGNVICACGTVYTFDGWIVSQPTERAA